MSTLPAAATLLEWLDEQTPRLRAELREADRLRTLPDPVVKRLIEQKLLRLWIPQSLGGLELDLPTTLEIYEAASRIDGSLGWAVMIGAGGGLFAAYLEPATAAEIFARPDALVAGSGAPAGKAETVEGGYRVTGSWRYASGATYATVFTANCIVTRDGKPVRGADGRELVRAMAFEPSQVRVLETWDSTGMRGTGSHDFEVRDAFVPERRSFSVFDDPPREPGPLYRLPFGVLTELPITAVAIGIARHALESFAEPARRKRLTPSGEPLAADPTVRAKYAESHATWRLAKAEVRALAEQAWQAAISGRALQPKELSEITASCVLCVAKLRESVADLASLAGMTAIQRDDELARAWRDLETLAAHFAVSPRNLTSAGAVLLG